MIQVRDRLSLTGASGTSQLGASYPKDLHQEKFK